MRVVMQRVSEGRVTVEGRVTGEIGEGYVILLGIEKRDEEEDVDWLVRKIVGMRIFGDEEGLMNRSLVDVGGSVLVVSQFTLHARVKKGTRPSFEKAARPEQAVPLYERFLEAMRGEMGEGRVASGEFGAMMAVALVNDGPVTIVMDSRERE
ncbi:MAG: D-aminoacyl-tRNA deacylase [Verrucomicrobiota bacterium]